MPVGALGPGETTDAEGGSEMTVEQALALIADGTAKAQAELLRQHASFQADLDSKLSKLRKDYQRETEGGKQ